MPELPEVETTRRGIAPHIENRVVRQVVVRESRLRWPVTEGLDELLRGACVRKVYRRGKYLLLETARGHLMIHLGMSGSLRIVSQKDPVKKHDHVDLVFSQQTILRFHDPRRFGSVLWITDRPENHPLLSGLGPEPLGDAFSASYLYRLSRKRTTSIKAFVMDSRVVVGVGNIYANEALFISGIYPKRKAGSISLKRMEVLVAAIRTILGRAIDVGGTTLRDFVGGDGKPGYFSQSLLVYGRAGQPCRQCQGMLREIRQNQRSTVYCPVCQK